MARTQARGYNHIHQAVRIAALARYTPGVTICQRCRQTISDPPHLIDLGHTDDRTGWTGLEHRHCNRSAGGRNGAIATARKLGRPYRGPVPASSGRPY